MSLNFRSLPTLELDLPRKDVWPRLAAQLFFGSSVAFCQQFGTEPRQIIRREQDDCL
jgi:hypothetical protein